MYRRAELLFGNVLGPLNSFLLSSYVKMTNDGCVKYYFFLAIFLYDFEYKRSSKCNEGCDFYGVAKLAQRAAVAKVGRAACFPPLCSHPSLKSALVPI